MVNVLLPTLLSAVAANLGILPALELTPVVSVVEAIALGQPYQKFRQGVDENQILEDWAYYKK